MRVNPVEQYNFDHTHSIAEAQNVLLQTEGGQEVDPAVNVGGRLLAIRDQGDLVFGDLNDLTGSIQVLAERENVPAFDDYKTLNVGDWVGIRGDVGRSRRGEPSVFVRDWARLAATEIPFPDKRKGLRDPDIIARQRYLDLASNPASRDRFIKRSRMISRMRQILDADGFIEVETPILQEVHGGASARPFETHHNALDQDMSLRIATELHLKRLVVGGLERVYEIGRIFRNEGISPRHNPEFTSIEVYAAYWDYRDQMKLTEDLVQALAVDLHGTDQITYQGEAVDLSTPWKRATMDELTSDAVDEAVDISTDPDRLRALCRRHGVEALDTDGPGALVAKLYDKLVEPNLRGPIFVTDYPVEISPLARDHRSRPGYTERFEGIVVGRELCNGYTELNNARIQYERFLDQERQAEHDDEAMRMDYDYIRALRVGLPPTAGLGIGIDRLAMLLTDAATIKDVILFPTLRADGYKLEY